LKERLEGATDIINNLTPVLDSFSLIMDTPEGKALLEKLKEAQDWKKEQKARAEAAREEQQERREFSKK